MIKLSLSYRYRRRKRGETLKPTRSTSFSELRYYRGRRVSSGDKNRREIASVDFCHQLITENKLRGRCVQVCPIADKMHSEILTDPGWWYPSAVCGRVPIAEPNRSPRCHCWQSSRQIAIHPAFARPDFARTWLVHRAGNDYSSKWFPFVRNRL